MGLPRKPHSQRLIMCSVFLLLMHGLSLLSVASPTAESLTSTSVSSSSSSSPTPSSLSESSSPPPNSSSSSLWSSSSRSWSTGLVWQHKPELDNTMTPPSSSFTHRYVTVQTRGMCAMACNTHTWCASFFYGDDGDVKTCLLESVALHSMTDVLPQPGFSYFLAASDWCSEKQGFVFFPGERFCFQVYTEVVTDWHTAHARCQSRGLNLVVPANGQQMALLLATVRRTKDFRKKNSYLGLIRPLDEWGEPWRGGVPTFVDVYNQSVSEEVLQEGFWVTHNPNNQKNNQNCLQIDRKRGNKLNDLWCSHNSYYICQKAWPYV